MWRGAVVRSKSGRDRYRVFAIVDVCSDGRVLIADGKLHTLADPKKKNLRHLTVLAADGVAVTSLSKGSDHDLCEFLRNFEKARESITEKS